MSGVTIQQARQAKGLTQQQLADIVKVARETIARYETDIIRPSLRVLERIADALGVEAGDLLKRKATA